MQRGDSSDSSEGGPESIPLCVVCEKAAVGRGPFAESYMCWEHLSVDVADAVKLKERVDEELRAYSRAGDGGATNWIHRMEEQVGRMNEHFDRMQQRLDSCRAVVTGVMRGRIETGRVWERDMEDVRSYRQETAKAAGDMKELVRLSMSMELSLEDLKADFDRLEKSIEESMGAEEQVERLGQVSEQFGRALARVTDATDGWRDAEVTATPDEIDEAVKTMARRALFDPIVFSHEVKLDGDVEWLAVCSDTSGFVGDGSGRVVAAESASEGSEALPEPCIFASFNIGENKEHLQVLSVDGSKKLRCHCDIDWEMGITGLHCDRQVLFIAQEDAVTVTELSGRKVRRIKPHIEGFVEICGIGGNAGSVFVSGGGNKIAVFNKESGEMETVITLSELPDAKLCDLAIQDNCILVIDRKHGQVHRVRIDTRQVVASHPTERSGLRQFAVAAGVAVDRRGRLFVSEHLGQTVRAVAADDGSLLWTLGVPGERGSGDGRLRGPCGLAVVTVGPREQLVVADFWNKRLVVLNVE